MNIVHKVILKNTVELYQKLLKNKIIKSCFESTGIKYVLDVGVGSGVSAQTLKKLFPRCEIEGLDIHNMLWQENNDIPITLYDGSHFPFKKDAFDVVLIFFVLHHANNPKFLLSEAKRVGRRYILVVEELNRNKVQNMAMILYDLLINLVIFGHFIQTPQFKTDQQLQELFKSTELVVKEKHIIKENLLIYRIAYLLDATG